MILNNCASLVSTKQAFLAVRSKTSKTTLYELKAKTRFEDTTIEELLREH
jgi:hypothetical protein